MASTSDKDRQSYLAALCCAIPYHFVEAVLASPTEESLATQDLDGSVLVIDLVGFTSVCERLASQGSAGLSELSQLLDRFFEWLELEAIFPFEGYIVQFAGDAVSVVFHGPEHARRCAACALTIRKHLHSTTRDKLLGDYSRDLQVRMGISVGNFRLNVLGDIARRFSLFTGQPAHRAIRLQKLAEPGQILADPQLAEQLGSDLEHQVVDRDKIQPTGLKKWPVRVAYQPLGERIESQVEEKIALLEPFVPHPLAMRMRTGLDGWRLQGEIRRATIVFADYLGFKEKPENLDLGQNVARSAMRAFRKYDGVVVNLAASGEGHRALILFGLDKPAENDAERAILASLEAVGRLKAFSGPLGMELAARIAINTGDVYIGSVGSFLKHDLTAVGDAVNVTARMLDRADPHEILATKEALDGIQHEFQLVPKQPIKARGRSDDQEVMRIDGTVEGRAHYFKRRRRPRFLAGRKKEIDNLLEIVESAWSGRGRIVGIAGQAGTGKSTLLTKALDTWAQKGGIGMLGYCRFATRSSPLAPLVDMFGTYFGFSPNDSEARRADLIRTGLQQMNLGRGFEDLLTLLQPVRRPDGLMEAIVDLAESNKQENVLESIAQFVNQRVHQDKICYVIEDLHLADTLTLAAVRRLMDLPRDNAFMAIATYRPDELAPGFRELFDAEIRVENLGQREASQLVCHELQASRIDPELAEFLWRRTAGNPEHLLQMIRFLAERLLICVENDTVCALAPGVGYLDDAIPTKWAHVALSRLEGMGELERRVLKGASIFGRHFDRAMLVHALSPDLDQDMLECALEILEFMQIITCLDRDSGRYRFRDETTRAIAYSMIPENDRRSLHRRVADALEKTEDGASHELAVALVHHRERAAQYNRAARWCERVVQTATNARLNREACYFAERWRTITDRLPEDEKPGRKRSAQVELAQLLATSRLGDSQRTFGMARRLVQHYHDALDRPSRSRVNLILAEAQTQLGQLVEAQARLAGCYRSSSADEAIRFEAALQTARTLNLKGELSEAAEWSSKAQTHVQDDQDRRMLLDLQIGELRLSQGDLAAAREFFERVASESENQGRILLQAESLRSLGKHALVMDQFESAQARLSKALHIERRMGNRRGECEVLLLLGLAHIWDYQPEAAREHLETALEIAKDTSNQIALAQALVLLGTAIAQTDDPQEGRRMCLEGRSLAERFGLAGVLADADLCLLYIGMDSDNPEELEIQTNRIRALSTVPLSPLQKRILKEAVTHSEKPERNP